MKIFIVGGLVSKSEDSGSAEPSALQRACHQLGTVLAEAGHEILVCSPFEDSADFHVIRGAASACKPLEHRISFYFVDTPAIRSQLETIVSGLGLSRPLRIPHPPPQSESSQSLRYAWLLCQLNAMESSHVTIALGGDSDGAANMLLLLAEGKRKAVLPLPFLGGAAKLAFERRRYELDDRLGGLVEDLHDEDCVSMIPSLLAALAEKVGPPTGANSRPPSFFISYSRERQEEADHVETLLRRRNLRVFRDETDFGAGHSVPHLIREAIFGATVFIALWSAAYACSPWCFDELELALDRHDESGLELWIFRVDNTRIVPKRARDLLVYDTPTRVALEARILDLVSNRVQRGMEKL